MSLVPYPSSDNETEKENVTNEIEQKVRNARVIIKLKPLSTYESEDENIKTSIKKNEDLLTLLPPIKHVKNNMFVPRVLSRMKARNFTAHEKFKRRFSIKKKVCTNVIADEVRENSIPLCNRMRKNCAPDVRDPNTLKNSDFREIFSAKIENVERVHRFDRNLIKSLTDPETELKEEVEDVNNTCKKKNHISYLVQMAKKNEQGLKTQWSNSKYTRQQTRAKYGF